MTCDVDLAVSVAVSVGVGSAGVAVSVGVTSGVAVSVGVGSGVAVSVGVDLGRRGLGRRRLGCRRVGRRGLRRGGRGGGRRGRRRRRGGRRAGRRGHRGRRRAARVGGRGREDGCGATGDQERCEQERREAQDDRQWRGAPALTADRLWSARVQHGVANLDDGPGLNWGARGGKSAISAPLARGRRRTDVLFEPAVERLRRAPGREQEPERGVERDAVAARVAAAGEQRLTA